MKTILLVFHLIIAAGLIGVILLQTSKGGLSGGLGGEFYRSKRGAERVVFILTFVLSGIFLLTSVANMLVR